MLKQVQRGELAMCVRKKVLGALFATVCFPGVALSQETVLSGALSQVLPGARVSWSSGVAVAGTETYEDLFLSQGSFRVRADRVTVTPEGPIARIAAERVIVNNDTDATFSLEISSAKTTLSIPMISALNGTDGIVDLCRIGASGLSVELGDLRVLRDVRQEGLTRVRSEIKADLIDLNQTVSPVETGCGVEVTLNLVNAQEVRSDKSGTRVDRFEIALSGPGSVETLTSASPPPVQASLTFSGFLQQVPGGASIAVIRDGGLDTELSALSAVPALTAYLRGRGQGPAERAVTVARALIPADVRASAYLTGTTLLAEALVPADRISGLSRASLTSVIGDYRAQMQTRSGQAAVEISADLIGLGESSIDLRARLSARADDAPDLGFSEIVERALPRTHLEAATIRHRDSGLLRAVELITGSPVSVLAAIFLKEGVLELPERWRPAARRAVSEGARFMDLTTRREGAEISVRTPTDLSVLETYRLLTIRPELADQLIASDVREVPAN